MKRVLISFIALLCAFSLNAQNFGFGIKAGADLSMIAISLDGLNVNLNSGAHTGFYAGGFANYSFTESFGLQGEVLVSYSGAAFSASEELMNTIGPSIEKMIMEKIYIEVPLHNRLQGQLNSWKATVPILLKYTSNHLSVLAGPYVSCIFGLNGSSSAGTGGPLIEDPDLKQFVDELVEDTVKDNLKIVNFGLNFGLEYKFNCGIFLSGNYSLGLRNTFPFTLDLTETNSITTTIYPSSLQFGIGYEF